MSTFRVASRCYESHAANTWGEYGGKTTILQPGQQEVITGVVQEIANPTTGPTTKTVVHRIGKENPSIGVLDAPNANISISRDYSTHTIVYVIEP